jgi:hypothetical protein
MAERYYEIQQYTGSRHGWETVCAEPDAEAADRCLQLYRENQPEFPVRKKVKHSAKPSYWGSNADKYHSNMGKDGYKTDPWLL